MYATKQDIIDRYGEEDLIVAADHDQDGVEDQNIVGQGLTDASDAIDGYIGGRYSLPLATKPPMLKRLCVDMALYLMSKPPTVTEEKRRRYDDAVKLLAKIASGDVTLGVNDPEGTGSAGSASFAANPRIFKCRPR